MSTRSARLLPAGIALFLLSACLSNASTTGDVSWVVQRCQMYRGDYCRVPFVVALSDTKLLAEKNLKVQLRGYLIREQGGFAIYADANSARLGWHSDALRVDASKSAEFSRTLERWNQSVVVIRGRLELKAADFDEYWASFVLDSSVSLAGIRGEEIKQ